MADVVIQTSKTGGGWQHQVFENIPTTSRGLVSVEAAGGPKAQPWSERLLSVLTTEIRRLGGSESGPRQYTMEPLPLGDATPGTTPLQSVTAIVVDPAGPPVQMNARFQSILADDQKSHSLLPILRRPDESRGERLSQFLPRELLTLNLDFIQDWPEGPEPIAEHLLALAGITTPDRRVFLSYRRTESSGLADDLHTALINADFDVFLDTVDVPPAAPFQEVLLEELGHKAMVVLLESPTYGTSQWCQEELRFAEKHELGLLVLRTPEYTQNGSPVRYTSALRPVIPSTVIAIEKNNLEDPNAAGAERHFDGDFLKELVLEIKLEHQRAFVQRKRQLQTNLLASLQAEGVDASVGPDGLIDAHHPACGLRHFRIDSTPRRPELLEFQRCYEAGKPDAIMIAFLAALRRQRRAPLNWVCVQAGLKLFDIVEIPDVARQLKLGSL